MHTIFLYGIGFLTEFSTTEISSQMIAVMDFADKYFQVSKQEL